MNPALLSPRPQYGRKISEPSVPSRDNLANVVTRSRSNTTASNQLFMGNNGTFLVEPHHPIIKAPLNGTAQSSLAFPSNGPSLPLWRRRATSKLARIGKASLAQGPKTILVPGSSGFDDEDEYDLQYTMKVSLQGHSGGQTAYFHRETLAADSLGLFSQNETTTPIQSKFNDSNHNNCESTPEDGLATPKASDFARKRAVTVTATSDVSNGPVQAIPFGSAFEVKRNSRISSATPSHTQDPPIVGLASDIIPYFPDPPRWVVRSPPRSAFDDYDDDET